MIFYTQRGEAFFYKCADLRKWDLVEEEMGKFESHKEMKLWKNQLVYIIANNEACLGVSVAGEKVSSCPADKYFILSTMKRK